MRRIPQQNSPCDHGSAGKRRKSSRIRIDIQAFAAQTRREGSINLRGLSVKTLVLCFDRARRYPGPDATNAARLFHLLDTGGEQFDWYHPGSADGRSPRSVERAAVAGEGRRRRPHGDRRGIRLPRRSVGARRPHLHLRRGPRRVLRADSDPATGHRRCTARSQGLRPRGLLHAAHQPHTARLGSGDASRLSTGRATPNQRSRMVSGPVGRLEDSRLHAPDDARSHAQRRPRPPRCRHRRPARRAPGRIGVRSHRGGLVPRGALRCRRRAGRVPAPRRHHVRLDAGRRGPGRSRGVVGVQADRACAESSSMR